MFSDKPQCFSIISPLWKYNPIVVSETLDLCPSVELVPTSQRKNCMVSIAPGETVKRAQLISPLNLYCISMDWIKGKFTGNHRFSHLIWGFPVNFPLIQSIEYMVFTCAKKLEGAILGVARFKVSTHAVVFYNSPLPGKDTPLRMAHWRTGWRCIDLWSFRSESPHLIMY